MHKQVLDRKDSGEETAETETDLECERGCKLEILQTESEAVFDSETSEKLKKAGWLEEQTEVKWKRSDKEQARIGSRCRRKLDASVIREDENAEKQIVEKDKE